MSYVLHESEGGGNLPTCMKVKIGISETAIRIAKIAIFLIPRRLK